MKKSLCILSICFAAFACCSACKHHNNPENPSDPKTEITNAVRAAALPVYHDWTVVRAKGEAVALSAPAGWAIAIKTLYPIARGGEQEEGGLGIFIVFFEPQVEVPTALYLDGGNGKEPVKVENIEMVTPELAVGLVIGGVFALLGVEPIQMASENVDGAPADSYLVDLKTTQRMGQGFDVLEADEVENNLEKFENMAFMRMHYDVEHILLSSIDQVMKIESDGPEDIFSIEPLVIHGFIMD